MSSHSDSEIKSSQTLRLKKSVLFKPTRSKYNHLKNYPVNTFLPTLQEQRLLTAVSTNNTETVKNLLESGVSPNTTDGLRSALHLAASKGYAEIVELLLKYGADPNKQDIVQNTALHLAACTSNLQIITLLINGGADITSLDIHGRNPVQLAKSKLDILRKSWKEGAIEMIQLRSQLQEVEYLYLCVLDLLFKHSNMYQHPVNFL